MNKNQAKICVPVCASSWEDIGERAGLAAQLGDIVEVRLDCLKQPVQDSDRACGLIRNLDRPVILTLRPAEQGGRCDLTYAARRQFWIRNGRSFAAAALLDVELDLAQEFSTHSSAPFAWNQVICSHHDFSGVPANLEQMYERMAQTPARFLKLAVQASDVSDCLPIFHLLERARGEGRNLIAIAMGTAGVATRVLGPAWDAFLTYGALDEGRGTAPGQLTARDLRELYRIDKIDRETQITGLIGLPVAHSVSPHIHNAGFEACGVNAVYLPLEVSNVETFIRRMIHPRTRELAWKVRGLSVTAPHKAAVMDHLDAIDQAGKEIGAINTIVVEADSLRGYNTDATAALRPVIERLGALRGGRCAVIGAGGAASAALFSIRREGARATVFARDHSKASVLADKFDVESELIEGAHLGGFDVVINCTPLGTRGSCESATAVTAEQLHGARLAYDMVYNPTETRFLREARAAGCDTLGGLPMLLAQACEQFTLWTGFEAPLEIMRDAALRGIESAL